MQTYYSPFSMGTSPKQLPHARTLGSFLILRTSNYQNNGNYADRRVVQRGKASLSEHDWNVHTAYIYIEYIAYT